MKLLIVSPSTPSSGNASTAKRIQGHFGGDSHECLLCDPKEIVNDRTKCPRSQLVRFMKSKSIEGVLFLHAFKSGNLLICSSQPNSGSCDCGDHNLIRYGIIFGGTDLNVDVLDANKLEVIKKVVKSSQFCVAFTEDLKSKALQLCDHLNVFVQPQAVYMPDENENFKFFSTYSPKLEISPSPNVFLMVTGIRDVKDPLFLVEEFAKWSSQKTGCRLVIIGPVLDAVYGKGFFKKLEDLGRQHGNSNGKIPKVVGIQEIDGWVCNPCAFPILYTPPLTSVDLVTLLHRDYILACVNSSISEGMSSAILESMSNRVMVIARDNPGNRSVITPEVSGLLFDSPKEFIKQAARILHDPALRSSLIEKAYAVLSRRHSIEKERKFYVDVCTKFFGSQ